MPDREYWHTVCTQYGFVWKDEVRLEECFWEEKVKPHRIFFFRLNYILLEFFIVAILTISKFTPGCRGVTYTHRWCSRYDAANPEKEDTC